MHLAESLPSLPDFNDTASIKAGDRPLAVDVAAAIEEQTEQTRREVWGKTGLLEDAVDFSAKAIERLKKSTLEPLKHGALSLREMDDRIATIQQQMDSIWNSALSDDEKMRQINSRKNEIALLQAGQFNFERSMSSIFSSRV